MGQSGCFHLPSLFLWSLHLGGGEGVPRLVVLGRAKRGLLARDGRDFLYGRQRGVAESQSRPVFRPHGAPGECHEGFHLPGPKAGKMST